MSPPACPICGERPSAVDYIEVDRGGLYTEKVPSVLHCPNERREDHLTPRR